MTALYLERLASAVGAQHASSENGRTRARPASASEISDVMRVAREAGVTVGVGVAPLALDLSRMRNILHLDETSLLVTVQAGMSAQALDTILHERGLHLPALPPISRARTVGALLSAPRPSEASPPWGRFSATCAGVTAVLADGTEISTRVAPRKATGPDLMYALIGSRGTVGVITAATLRVVRRGELREEAAWAFPSLREALSAARQILVRGGRPFDMQIASTVLSVASEGPRPLVEAERELCNRIALEHGARPVPFTPPPLMTAPPEEKSFPLESLPEKVSDSARVVGWHTGGAAIVDAARAPGPTPAPHPIHVALKRRLDPSTRLPPWPGA